MKDEQVDKIVDALKSIATGLEMLFLVGVMIAVASCAQAVNMP